MKNKKLNHTELVIEKKGRGIQLLEKLLPNIFIVIGELFKKYENFDPACPQTTLNEIEDLIASLSLNFKVREKTVIRLIRMIIKKSEIKKIVLSQLEDASQLVKNEALKDKRYSLLLNLMRDVDEKFPYSSLLVSARHGDPRDWLVTQCNPLPYLQNAHELTGERRASAVLEAFRRTAEYLYSPYIITLWRLAYLREGVSVENHPDVEKISFGQFLEVASKKLADYPQLISVETGWMRNCVTHEIPKYDVKNDCWEMKDNKSQPITVKVDDLLSLTEDIYQMSSLTISRVGQLYLLREFYLKSGLVEIFVEHIPSVILEENKENIANFDKNVKNHLEKMLKIN